MILALSAHERLHIKNPTCHFETAPMIHYYSFPTYQISSQTPISQASTNSQLQKFKISNTQNQSQTNKQTSPNPK